MDKRDCIQIGELARICDVSVQTLHYYDKIGYLKPVYTDPDTGYRHYSRDQILYLMNTKLFQAVGCKLKEIKDILREGSLQKIIAIYRQKQQELDYEIAVLQDRKKKVGAYLDYYETMLSSRYDQNEELEKIKLKELPSQGLVFVRQQITYDYPSLMFFYNQLLNLVFENNLKVHKELITVFHGGYRDIYHQKTDIELALTLRESYGARACIRKQASGLYVTAVHQGKYPTSIATYQNMQQWMVQNGYEAAGPVLHVLLVPIAAASPEATVFEIRIPVHKS